MCPIFLSVFSKTILPHRMKKKVITDYTHEEERTFFEINMEIIINILYKINHMHIYITIIL